MHLAVERGVPIEERKTVTAGLPDWDSARIFWAAVRCGSFRSAAERFGLSINVERRRIDDFEPQTGEASNPQNTLGLETNSSIYGNLKRYIWAHP